MLKPKLFKMIVVVGFHSNKNPKKRQERPSLKVLWCLLPFWNHIFFPSERERELILYYVCVCVCVHVIYNIHANFMDKIVFMINVDSDMDGIKAGRWVGWSRRGNENYNHQRTISYPFPSPNSWCRAFRESGTPDLFFLAEIPIWIPEENLGIKKCSYARCK